MATKSPASISRVGQRGQIVIPKRMAEELRLYVGDLVALERRRGSLVVKPQKSADADDTLTPEEEKLLTKAEKKIRRGQYVTLAGIDHEMARRPRGRGPQTA